MPKTNRQKEIVEEVAYTISGDKVFVDKVVEEVKESVTEKLLNNEEVHLKNFGTFRVKRRRGRKVPNLKGDGTFYTVKSKAVVKFDPSVVLKKRISDKLS